MNDTHTFDKDADDASDTASSEHPVDKIAAMDPADAPAAAEGFAAELAAELENSGATPPDPVQLQADLPEGGDAADLDG